MTRAIIIGAGRGQRLMPTTANGPKCFAEIGGKRILDWIVDALTAGGVDDICFVGGYRIDDVRAHYPHFTFRHNVDWPNNNILASLMYAEDLMDREFVTTYSDILYGPEIVRALVDSRDDLALGVDTDWREHYRPRSMHPPHDAEKLIARDGRVVRVHRAIPSEEATGEFIGVARFSARGRGSEPTTEARNGALTVTPATGAAPGRDPPGCRSRGSGHACRRGRTERPPRSSPGTGG